MKIAFNPSTVAALTTAPNNKDITFDLRGRNIFARGVKFYGTDTNTWRDIKINNVSIGSHTLDLRNGSNTTLTNTNGVVTINSTWRPVVDNLTSDSATSSLSANQGRVLAGLINGKSDSDHNHDGRYIRKSGDTMLGALNFANGTWNLVGDDSYMGDCNISGHFGIKAANTTYPGIAFFNKTGNYLGNLTAYSGNIKYGAYSLQFLDNGNTSVNASTWTNPFSAYNSNAVADGQAICVWGQSSYLGNLSADTGDMSLWLKRVNAKVATLNMVLDGEYYAGGNQRLAHVSEIPTSLKNPYALTISLNGTSQGPYDGSAAKNINITPGSIGAATSGHNHDDRYLKLTGGTMLLGEGLKFHSNDNYFGTNADARIISLLDNNDKICDGGLIIDERATLNGKEYVTELLRIRDSEFKWRGADILHSGNYSGILDSRYYTESEVNSLLSKKLDRVNLSVGSWNPRGYNLAADYFYNGGDLSISENSGKIYVSIDGQFYQNEGQYRVLDTSDVAGLKGDLTVHQYLSNTDTIWWPLIWGGSSHNNASNSTGAVYKSHDVLSWQTSSQTLYATNIRTENIKHLSIGGGIFWNPNVESATDSTDAASITLVKSGVAGGTTLVLSQMNGTNDTIQFKTSTAARLYHNSYPILTTQNTYVNNHKGYIYGAEITQVNNSDTVDGWHKDEINRTLFITSGISGLSSYWAKLWEINLNNQYDDVTITFLAAASYYPSYFSIFSVYLRQNGSGTSKGINARLVELIGNIAVGDTELRLYVNNTTGNCQLWGNVKNQYGTMNLSVLKKAWRTDTDSSNIGTFFSTSFSSVQSLPGDGWYKVGVIQQGVVGAFNPASHTHTWTSITDKIVAGNEFNIVNAGFKENLWFNYLPINDRSKSATINAYCFGNGNKGYTAVRASGFIKNGGNEDQLLRADGGVAAFNWAGQSGQPTWLWGGNNFNSYYVYNPSNFSVKYAASAGNADTVDGYHVNGSNVAPYGHIPSIENDGVMEVGKYIDFHNDNSGKHDFSTRLQTTGNYGNSVYLPSHNGTLALISDNVASATKLATARSIWGQSFDGTRDINGTIYINNGNSENGAIILNNNVNTHARISAIGDQVVFNTGSALRFGGTEWEYSDWAGLKYDTVANTIYLGIADGTVFNYYSSKRSNGTLKLPGISNIDLNSGTSIRGLATNGSPYFSHINLYDTSISLTAYGDISMSTGPGAIKLTAGQGANASIGSDFKIEASRGVYLNQGNSGNVSLCQGGGKVGIGTMSPVQKLDVNGQVRASGFIHSDHSINDAVLLAGGGYERIFKLGTTRYYNNTSYELSFHKLSSLCNNLVWVDGCIWNSTSISFQLSSDFYPYFYANSPSMRTIYRMDGNNMITVDGNGIVVISCSSYPRRVGFFYTGRA